MTLHMLDRGDRDEKLRFKNYEKLRIRRIKELRKRLHPLEAAIIVTLPERLCFIWERREHFQHLNFILAHNSYVGRENTTISGCLLKFQGGSRKFQCINTRTDANFRPLPPDKYFEFHQMVQLSI
jgi:hypothetical protein